jgi:Domain of unknown function (DUF4190)
MSQVSPGPGWWLASDGRWYPPHLAPWAPHPSPTDAPKPSAFSPEMYPTPGYPPVSQPGYPPVSQPGYPPVWPPGYPPASPPRVVLGTNGLAVTSLVLGILWIYWVGSILALVFGYVALVQIRERNESGRGMAIAGIVLGWIGVGIGLLALVIALIVSATGNGP